MRKLDFYEFAGILLPGAVALAALAFWFEGDGLAALIREVGLGGLGVFVVLAYTAGHIVQAIGNLVEFTWWKCWRGMPSDWIRTKPNNLLAPQQVLLLRTRVGTRLGFGEPDFGATSSRDWYAITRQIYADVQGAGRSGRVDVFNGNYGLNRGLAAGLVVALAAVLVRTPHESSAVAFVIIALVLALYRMHRFGRHYARELFVQFLQLPQQGIDKEMKP